MSHLLVRLAWQNICPLLGKGRCLPHAWCARHLKSCKPSGTAPGVQSQGMLTCTHNYAHDRTSEAVAVVADEAQYAMSKSLPVAIADPDEYVAIFIAGDTLLQCPLPNAPIMLHRRVCASLSIATDKRVMVVLPS